MREREGGTGRLASREFILGIVLGICSRWMDSETLVHSFLSLRGFLLSSHMGIFLDRLTDMDPNTDIALNVELQT